MRKIFINEDILEFFSGGQKILLLAAEVKSHTLTETLQILIPVNKG